MPTRKPLSSFKKPPVEDRSGTLDPRIDGGDSDPTVVESVTASGEELFRVSRRIPRTEQNRRDNIARGGPPTDIDLPPDRKSRVTRTPHRSK